MGDGEYTMYLVLAKQPRKFDNDVADGGLTLQRMIDEGILTGELADPDSDSEATWGFDFHKLVEVKGLQPLKVHIFTYNSKFPLQCFFYNGGTQEIQFMLEL